jgi:hypothetical protein
MRIARTTITYISIRATEDEARDGVHGVECA